MAFVLGSRGENVGVDTITYYNYLGWLSNGDVGYMELGWNALFLLFNRTGLPTVYFINLVALLTLGFIFFVAKKNISNPSVVILFLFLLEFYTFFFNGMRQGLAMSLGLVAMHYYSRDNNTKAAILILIATLIHSSSIILMLIFPISAIKFDSRRALSISILTLLIGIVIPVRDLMSISGQYAKYVTEYGVRDNYVTLMAYGLMQNFFFYIFYKNSYKYNVKDKWLKIYLLNIILFNIFIQSKISLRIVFFFSIAQIIIFSRFYKNDSRIFKYALLFGVLNLLRFMIPEFLNSGNDGSIIPYKLHEDILTLF